MATAWPLTPATRRDAETRMDSTRHCGALARTGAAPVPLGRMGSTSSSACKDSGRSRNGSSSQRLDTQPALLEVERPDHQAHAVTPRPAGLDLDALPEEPCRQGFDLAQIGEHVQVAAFEFEREAVPPDR